MSDLFPHGGDVAKASFWCGLRPMTPDGPPVVGPTKVDGLLLETGHGTLGWTMAAGTGRVVADLVAAGGRRSRLRGSDSHDRCPRRSSTAGGEPMSRVAHCHPGGTGAG